MFIDCIYFKILGKDNEWPTWASSFLETTIYIYI
jgi:hypothetical protein